MQKVGRYDTEFGLYWEGPGFGRQLVPPEQLLYYASGLSATVRSAAVLPHKATALMASVSAMSSMLAERANKHHVSQTNALATMTVTTQRTAVRMAIAMARATACQASVCVRLDSQPSQIVCGGAVQGTGSALDMAPAMTRWVCAYATVATWARTANTILATRPVQDCLAFLQSYNAYDFTQRTGAEARPNIARSSTTLFFPGLGRDWNSVIYSGVISSTLSGWFCFRCRHSSNECTVFLKRTLIADDTPVYLEANTPHRLKLEHQHATYSAHHYLERSGPHRTRDEASSASASAFAVVPAEDLSYEVVCSDGCSGRGCCLSDGRCRCEPGYGGHDCSLHLDTCGVDAPSGPFQTGGLRARYFADSSFGTVVTEQVDARAYLAYGQRPAGVSRLVGWDRGVG